MRYSGVIGFVETVETSPGVWLPDQVTERVYYGNVRQNSRRWESGESANDDLSITNQLSIVADDLAISKVSFMKYAVLYGTKWKIVNVSINRPRILLTLGGVYNG